MRGSSRRARVMKNFVGDRATALHGLLETLKRAIDRRTFATSLQHFDEREDAHHHVVEIVSEPRDASRLVAHVAHAAVDAQSATALVDDDISRGQQRAGLRSAANAIADAQRRMRANRL